MAPPRSESSQADASNSSSGSEEGGPPFCIAGIGASAGGLAAYRQLLAALPSDSGLGFVIVQHLSPAHASNLAEILSRSTSMPVVEVADEPRVEANHVYVIPPGKTMIVADRHLKLRPREPQGQNLPVDIFFRSLAEDQAHRALGVVLSGTGSDGTAGLKEIKAAGGITFAQDASAEHDGMPRSAIASGCVDFVLPPGRIAEEIARIACHSYIAPPVGEPESRAEEPDLSPILNHLHLASRVDFSQYKVTTVRRRIARRMLLHRLENMSDYAALLRERPEETEALFQDILIGVTGFFRDPQTFEALASEVIPKLLADRSSDDPLRIWVLGCSTGEEAYSYAMAAAELTQDSPGPVPVQVFATDLNAASVATARSGVYPKSIAQTVSEPRLRRFFSEIDQNYRINKAIRDMCVFACHNALVDPPFSRVDIISCRNLLIYLNEPLQKRLLNQLHYALKPSAYLVLGNSETIGGFRNLFESADARHKIYRKEGGPGHMAVSPPARRHTAYPAGGSIGGEKEAPNRPDALKEADQLLLAKYAPPAVLVNADMEILQFRGDTSAYLAPAQGKASLNLLKMARAGVLVALRAAIHKAKKQNDAVREEGLRLNIDGEDRGINLEVMPVRGATAKESRFLVVFEDIDPGSVHPAKKVARPSKSPKAGESAAEELAAMAQELDATKEYLQSVIEQQEVANEELQSANEEAQSANEELQSLNEELATSQEEIQSSNEELATVNDELENRNREVSLSNSDLVNLLGSIDTAIMMVGRDLRIRRYTHMAEKTFNLIPADIGRPVTDIKTRFALPNLDQLLAEAIDSVIVKEVEVHDTRGQWYLLRIRPYRTLDGKIDGAVIILVDIDTIRRAREFADNIVATVREPMLVLDADLRVRRASQSFGTIFHLASGEIDDRPLSDICAGAWDVPALHKALREVLSADRAFEDFALEGEFPPAGRLALLLNARRLVQVVGSAPLVLLGIQNITERRKLQESLLQVAQLSEVDRNRNEFLAMLSHELRNPLAPLRNSLHVLKSAGADDKTREHAREMMERQIVIMTRLVDDLLDSARVTQGKIGLIKQTVSLPTLLNRVALSIQPLMDSRNQVLTLSMLSDPVYVDADSVRLEQAIGNLLHNASKFSAPGARISLAAELAPAQSGRDGGGDAIVRIRDSGAGISAEALPHVFELFMQSDRSLDRTQGGLGIGLTLTRKLVELHGGSIHAFSEGLGKGSEFVVRLPVVPAGSFEAPPASAAQRDDAERRLNILIVDDNIDAAESLAAILRLAGHQARTAYKATDALHTAQAIRPDAIVLDIGLPEMDGYELARQMRGQPALSKVLLIALTGYGREEDRLRARAAGFDHHFTKPVDNQLLKEILDGLQTDA